MQDTSIIQLGALTEIEGTIFGVRSNIIRPYEYYDNVHISITYEFDLNQYRIDREAYNMLDWLGDIGGLKEAIVIVLGFIYGLLNYNKFENFLVSKLYKSNRRPHHRDQIRSIGSRMEDMGH